MTHQRNHAPRAKQRDDSSLLKDFMKLPTRAGAKVIQQALLVYTILTDPMTPRWARLILAAALIYLVNPCDAIPDAVPVLGFTDDAAALALALSRVAAYVTPEIEARATRLLPSWAVGTVGTVGGGVPPGPAAIHVKPNNINRGT